jgi:hypothetical protein
MLAYQERGTCDSCGHMTRRSGNDSSAILCKRPECHLDALLGKGRITHVVCYTVDRRSRAIEHPLHLVDMAMVEDVDAMLQHKIRGEDMVG